MTTDPATLPKCTSVWGGGCLGKSEGADGTLVALAVGLGVRLQQVLGGEHHLAHRAGELQHHRLGQQHMLLLLLLLWRWGMLSQSHSSPCRKKLVNCCWLRYLGISNEKIWIRELSRPFFWFVRKWLQILLEFSNVLEPEVSFHPKLLNFCNKNKSTYYICPKRILSPTIQELKLLCAPFRSNKFKPKHTDIRYYEETWPRSSSSETRGQKWPTKVEIFFKVHVLKCCMASFESWRLLL